MPSSIFLKLDKIKGESQVDKYPEHIDVIAWSWGASNSGTTHEGAGSGGGASHFSDISITKELDTASPTLMQFLASGKHIATGELICTRSGNELTDAYVEYHKLEFKDLIITSRSIGGSNGERILTESFTLNFGSFKETYTPQTKEGTPGEAVDIEWDIAAKKAQF